MKDWQFQASLLDLPIPVTEFGQMTEGNRYFKVGSTFGITVGECNGVELEINRTGETWYNPEGNLITLGLCTFMSLW